MKDIFSGEISASDDSFFPILTGFIFAFFTGILACKWMIKIVKNSQLKYFSYYCFVIGGLIVGISLIIK